MHRESPIKPVEQFEGVGDKIYVLKAESKSTTYVEKITLKLLERYW